MGNGNGMTDEETGEQNGNERVVYMAVLVVAVSAVVSRAQRINYQTVFTQVWWRDTQKAFARLERKKERFMPKVITSSEKQDAVCMIVLGNYSSSIFYST